MGWRPAARLTIGALCVIVGAIWVGQGVGIIGGSFMTGEAVWAVIGAVAIVFGVVIVRGGRRRPEA